MPVTTDLPEVYWDSPITDIAATRMLRALTEYPGAKLLENGIATADVVIPTGLCFSPEGPSLLEMAENLALSDKEAKEQVLAFLDRRLKDAARLRDMLMSIADKEITPFGEIVLGGGPSYCAVQGRIAEIQDLVTHYYRFDLNEMRYDIFPDHRNTSESIFNSERGDLNIANHLLSLEDTINALHHYIRLYEQDIERGVRLH